MADSNAAAARNKMQEDPSKVAEEVVNNLKSQGLFDKFRKECLEELENMESYRLLKQRVENHVASFLSKFQWSEKLSKNSVRDSLRANINRSEVLLNGIDRLIDQILSSKTESFADRIGPEVDKHLGIERKEEPAPGTTNEYLVPDTIDIAIQSSTSQASGVRSLSTTSASQIIQPSPQSGESKTQSSNIPNILVDSTKGCGPRSSPQNKDQTDLKTKPKLTVDKNPYKCEEQVSNQYETKELPKNAFVSNDNQKHIVDTDSTNINSKDGFKCSGRCDPLNSARTILCNMDNEVCSVSDASKFEVITEFEIKANSVNTETAKVNAMTVAKKEEAVQDKPRNSELNVPEGKTEAGSLMTSVKAEENPKDLSEPNAEIAKLEESMSTNIEQKSISDLNTDNENYTFEKKSNKECLLEEKVEVNSETVDCVTDVTHTEDAASPTYDSLPSKPRDSNNEELRAALLVKMEKEEDAVDKHKGGGKGVNDTMLKAQDSNEDPHIREQIPTDGDTTLKKADIREAKEEEYSDVEMSNSKPAGADGSNVILASKTICDEDLAAENISDRNEIGRERASSGKDDEESTSIDSAVMETMSCSEEDEKYVLGCSKNDASSQTKQVREEKDSMSLSDVDNKDQKEEAQFHDKAESTLVGSGSESLTNFDLSSDSKRKIRTRKRLISESDDNVRNSKSAKVAEHGPAVAVPNNTKTEAKQGEHAAVEVKMKRGRGRPKKVTEKKVEETKSDTEMRSDGSTVDDSTERSRGRSRVKKQDELAFFKSDVKRQTSVDNESSASDSMTETKEKDARRTRRQIKPKRCYSPSDSK